MKVPKILYYNHPKLDPATKKEVQRMLAIFLHKKEVAIVEKGSRDGSVVDLLKGQCSDCTIVEIDRTDPDVSGFMGLQEARRNGEIDVHVVAYRGYAETPSTEDILRPLSQ